MTVQIMFWACPNRPFIMLLGRLCKRLCPRVWALILPLQQQTAALLLHGVQWLLDSSARTTSCHATPVHQQPNKPGSGSCSEQGVAAYTCVKGIVTLPCNSG